MKMPPIALALVLTGCSPLQLVGTGMLFLGDAVEGAGGIHRAFGPRPTCPPGVDPQAVTWCRIADADGTPPAEK